jgi:hypothetical protein
MLTLLYVGFLITIVVLANLGMAKNMFALATDTLGGDKTAHAVLMGMFSFLANSALCCRKSKFGPVSIMTGSLIVYALVLGEEFSQLWQSRRTPDPVDATFDVIGIYLFAGLAKINQQINCRRKKIN